MRYRTLFLVLALALAGLTGCGGEPEPMKKTGNPFKQRFEPAPQAAPANGAQSN